MTDLNKYSGRRGGAVLAGLAIGLLGLTGCKTGWFKSSPKSEGVPLAQFYAKNKDYFPPFVKKFFTGAEQYESAYPTMKQARSGAFDGSDAAKTSTSHCPRNCISSVRS